MPLQIRRGTDAERLTMTQPLAAGELLYVTNTQRIYVGDNSTLGGIAVTGYTTEDAQDAAAAMITAGTHAGISFTYNDALNRLDATVDLSTFEGPIVADSLKGSVFAEDSSIMVDAIDEKIYASNGFFGNLTGNVTGNLTGNVTGNSAGTHTGAVIGNVIGNVTGDVRGSIFADNSSLIVDGTTGQIFGDVVGGLYGDVYASDSTRMVDSELVKFTAGDTTISSTGIEYSGVGGTFAIGTNASNDFFFDVFSRDFTLISAGDGTVGGASSFFRQRVAKSSLTSPVALVYNDAYNILQTQVWNGSAWETNVNFVGQVDSNTGDITRPGKLSFAVKAAHSTDIPNQQFGFIGCTFNSRGVLEAPALKSLGYLTTSARNTAHPSPTAGMIVFNAELQKFQGYVTDTGLAAGGASNATPGWVDLN